MSKITAQAFEHTNVAGKKLQYLRISNGQKEIIINVGTKTYNTVKSMEDENESLQTPTQPNGGKMDSKNNKS